MGKNRLEAFSDGVLAIVITIMVLEMKVPHGADVSALTPLLPVFLGYVLSFVYVGIYWNNHHHLLHTVHHVSGKMLWANLHLLFWLSLLPLATGWMGQNPLAPLPNAFYGGVLLMAASAYLMLQRVIMSSGAEHGALQQVIGRDIKGKTSVGAYATAIVLSFWQPLLAQLVYLCVALLWLIPDRRIEETTAHN